MMKKVILTLVVAVSLVVIICAAGPISAGAAKLANKVRFAVHVAELYTKDPDQKLKMPVQGITRSQMSDTWHASRDSNRLHEGQDIFAPHGTPVLSATEGYVMNIGENPLGGQTVSVIGAAGRVYYYAHLSAYAANLANGDQVTTKTVLGYVGNTGNAATTPDHLHFGVYTRGGAINPMPLIEDRPKPKPKRNQVISNQPQRNRRR